MARHDPEFNRKAREAFRGTGYRSLAEVREAVAKSSPSTWRRDALSAIDTVAKKFARPLSEISASPAALQRLFRSKTHGELGLSKKRYENVRSAVLQASRRISGRNPVRRALPHSDDWRALLERITVKMQRYGLHRLAGYCSAIGVRPNQITDEVLVGFLEALEAEGAVARPKRALINAITHWNWCAKNIAAWPAPARLSVPNPHVPFMKPWSAFPPSFHADFKRWADRLTKFDAFDYDTARRALRPATLRNHDVMVRNYASALAASGTPIAKIRRLADLVPSFKVYKTVLQLLHRRTGREDATEYLGKHARLIFNIANYHCETNKKQLKEMKALCRHLERPKNRTLTKANREKLRQFDNPENVDKLLNYPAEEYARSSKASTPLRRAKYVERALSVDLLIRTCLRLFNLRTLRLADFRWQQDGCYLEIPEERVKNRQQLSFLIPEATADILREYIKVHRPLLSAKGNEHLFAGRGMGPRHQNSLRDEIESSLRKHTGLIMNPHLFRAALAKIHIQENPANAMMLSRLFGHTTPTMTYQKYLGTEGPEASRRLDRSLEARRDASRRKPKK